MKNIILLLSAFLFVFGCKPKLDKDLSFNAGTANFSNTIYVGDNLLSGYTNGGLYANGQENSIAQILALQYAQVGGNEVKQPTFSGNGSGYISIENYSNGNFTLANVASNSSSTTSMNLFSCNSDSVLPVYSSFGGSINNYSFPGLKVQELLVQNIGNVNSDLYNPFLDRVTSNSGNFIDIINAESPTFFIVAFGLSDVLNRVENGWSCGSSSQDLFELNYDTLVSTLSSKSDKGILCEIPNIEKLPYLNANYISTQDIYIQAKQHINDNSYEVRKLEDGDQFLRNSIEKIGVNGYGLSDSMPIKNIDIIDRKEIDDIASEIFRYNQFINQTASKYNLPVVSMENYLIAESGTFLGDSIVLNGTNTQIDYKLGSAISLDGVFPTPRGSAAIANKFINGINEFYEAKIPLVDINQYPGLQLP